MSVNSVLPWLDSDRVNDMLSSIEMREQSAGHAAGIGFNNGCRTQAPSNVSAALRTAASSAGDGINEDAVSVSVCALLSGGEVKPPVPSPAANAFAPSRASHGPKPSEAIIAVLVNTVGKSAAATASFTTTSITNESDHPPGRPADSELSVSTNGSGSENWQETTLAVSVQPGPVAGWDTNRTNS